MAINHFFQSGVPMGRTSEQNLYEDIIIECLKIYGFEMIYLPRKTISPDVILNEDYLNKYELGYNIEMYMSNVQGFQGEGDLLTKFGVEIRDTATFIVSRRRWTESIARFGQTQLESRPTAGDVIYFPLTKSFFEIRTVSALDPFFQIGKLYVFTLECELMQYSSERFTTNVDEVNVIVNRSFDINEYELQLEDGNVFLLEFETKSKAILESFSMQSIDPLSQNQAFESEIDVLDFTDRNPFGEVYNS
jgi:hypothetical protein